MARETDEGTLTISMTFETKPATITAPHQIEESIDESRVILEKIIEEFASMDSGWQLISVNKMILKTATYNPLGGSSFLPMLPKIQRTKAVLNIQNFDDKCFLWCVIAHIHPLRGALRGNACRVMQYKRYEHELNVHGLSWPLELRQIDTFEKNNVNISVNVMGMHEDSCIVPFVLVSSLVEYMKLISFS